MNLTNRDIIKADDFKATCSPHPCKENVSRELLLEGAIESVDPTAKIINFKQIRFDAGVGVYSDGSICLFMSRFDTLRSFCFTPTEYPKLKGKNCEGITYSKLVYDSTYDNKNHFLIFVRCWKKDEKTQFVNGSVLMLQVNGITNRQGDTKIETIIKKIDEMNFGLINPSKLDYFHDIVVNLMTVNPVQ